MRTVDFLLTHRLLVVCVSVLTLLPLLPIMGQEVDPVCVADKWKEWEDTLDMNVKNMERKPMGLDRARLCQPNGKVGDLKGTFHGEPYCVILEEEGQGLRNVREYGEGEKYVRMEATVKPPAYHLWLPSLYISMYTSNKNCTFVGDTSSHGKIVLHPIFQTLAFSPKGDRLVYLAETSSPSSLPSMPWVAESPEMGGDWGHSVRSPGLYILDLSTRGVRQLSLPYSIVPGHSDWTPDGKGIVTVTRPREFNPCPECTDLPTRLALVSVESSQVTFLSPAEWHVSRPVFPPGGQTLLYFSNPLTENIQEKDTPVSPNAAQSLVLQSMYLGTWKKLLDDRIEGMTQIHPDRENPWGHRQILQDGRVIFSSHYIGQEPRMLVADLNEGAVSLVEHKTGLILDVLGSAILSLHICVKHGLSLRLGVLSDNSMTTMESITNEGIQTTTITTALHPISIQTTSSTLDISTVHTIDTSMIPSLDTTMDIFTATTKATNALPTIETTATYTTTAPPSDGARKTTTDNIIAAPLKSTKNNETSLVEVTEIYVTKLGNLESETTTSPTYAIINTAILEQFTDTPGSIDTTLENTSTMGDIPTTTETIIGHNHDVEDTTSHESNYIAAFSDKNQENVEENKYCQELLASLLNSLEDIPEEDNGNTDPVMLIHENAQTDKISARVVRSIGDTQEKDDSSTQTESHLLLSSSSVITPSYMEAMEDQGIVTVSPHYEDNEDNFIDIPENVTQIYVKYFTNSTENAEETMEHVTDSTEHASIITNYVKDATEVITDETEHITYKTEKEKMEVVTTLPSFPTVKMMTETLIRFQPMEGVTIRKLEHYTDRKEPWQDSTYNSFLYKMEASISSSPAEWRPSSLHDTTLLQQDTTSLPLETSSLPQKKLLISQKTLLYPQEHSPDNRKLLVIIPDITRTSPPLLTVYLWLSMGWDILQVHYPGLLSTPTSDHVTSLLQCHQAVKDIRPGYSHILLLGQGLGGTIAANLAATYPGEYSHLVLMDAVLSLPALVTTYPQYLMRSFGLGNNWFTTADLASAWAASPLAKMENITASALILTSNEMATKQARVFLTLQKREEGSKLYQVNPREQMSLQTSALILHWASRQFDDYSTECRITTTTTTTTTSTTTIKTTTTAEVTSIRIKVPGLVPNITSTTKSSASILFPSSGLFFLCCVLLTQTDC